MYDLWCLVPVHDSDNISPLLIDVFKYNIFFYEWSKIISINISTNAMDEKFLNV
jgi:hypothetical protein